MSKPTSGFVHRAVNHKQRAFSRRETIFGKEIVVSTNAAEGRFGRLKAWMRTKAAKKVSRRSREPLQKLQPGRVGKENGPAAGPPGPLSFLPFFFLSSRPPLFPYPSSQVGRDRPIRTGALGLYSHRRGRPLRGGRGLEGKLAVSLLRSACEHG